MNKRITYLTTGLTLGGAEIQLTQLAIGMRRLGWDVTVVSMLPPVDLVDELEENGVQVETLNMRPIPNPMAILKLIRLLQRKDTVILHSHMAKANFLGRIAGRIGRVPVQISTAHNTVEGGRLIELAYRLTDRLADVTTNVSQRAIDRYVAIKAVSPSRAKLMYNGLDTRAFVRDADVRADYRKELGLGNRFCWLAVGRLSPGKDYPNMIRAFGYVVKKDPEVRLIVVGKGPLGEEIDRMIAAFDLSDNIAMLGERKDIPALMSAADGFVMSSAWEGAPMVLLEASASRLPVVTTDVGGNAELIQNAKTGIVVEPGDGKALADVILQVMSMSEEQRETLGAAGRTYVEKEFSLPTVLSRWEDLYQSLIEYKTG